MRRLSPLWLSLSLSSLLLATPALAVTVDFAVDPEFAGANPVPSFPFPAPTASFTVVDVGGSGVDLTLEATAGDTLVTDNVNFTPGGGSLSGTGIFTLFGDTDSTEISDNEVLTIRFSEPVRLDEIVIGKLFPLGSPKDQLDEVGIYNLGVMDVSFTAANLDGFLTIPVGGAVVADAISFRPDNSMDDMDFTVRGITFRAVPEPSEVLAWLGLGLALALVQRVARPRGAALARFDRPRRRR